MSCAFDDATALVVPDLPPDHAPRVEWHELPTPSLGTLRRSMRFQIVIDSADPHSLCRFWAHLLHYEVDRDPDFVRRMVDAGAATPADVIEYDGVLTWRTAAACSDPTGNGPRLLFQRPDGLPAKTDRNRLHLDLNPSRDDSAALVERALELGATRMWDGGQGAARWVTLADPEGNEFCITL